MSSLLASSSGNLDISNQSDVLTYEYDGAKPAVVIARVDFGSDDRPVAGGANYSATLTVNGRLAVPASLVAIPSGTTKATMVSRSVVLLAGDTVVLSVTGDAGDVASFIAAGLVDVTPISADDLTSSVLTAIAAALADQSGNVLEAITAGLANIEVRPEKQVLGPCSRGVDPAFTSSRAR